MSKAFERVNHDVLLSQLANKGSPTHFVRIFKFVYAQTTVNPLMPRRTLVAPFTKISILF